MPNRFVVNHSVCRACLVAVAVAVACVTVHSVLVRLSAASALAPVGTVGPGASVGSVSSAGALLRGVRVATGRQEAGAWRPRATRAFVAAWGDRPVLLWLVSSVGRWSQHRAMASQTGLLRSPPRGCGDAFLACHRCRGRPVDALSSPQQPNTAYTHQLISGRDSVTKGENRRA